MDNLNFNLPFDVVCIDHFDDYNFEMSDIEVKQLASESGLDIELVDVN